MDLEAVRKLQHTLKLKKNREERVRNVITTPKITVEELIEEAKKIDKSKDRSRKTKTAQELAEDELKYMMLEEITPEPDDKPKFKIIIHDLKKTWDVPIGEKIEYFDPNLSYELTGYRPITEVEGLDFDPKKFTEAADSYRKNGRYTMYSPGTFRNKLFWTEEWNRCCNGYKVGKYRLTGLNYFWLNYYRLQSNISSEADDMNRIEDFPSFLAKQYEYFHYLELVKLLKKDGLIFKARGVNIAL